MTAETQMQTTTFIPNARTTPLSAVDRTFDPGEICARCGPGTRAQVKWVFPSISEFTHEHHDLYFCVHCSSVGVHRLLRTSILHVFAPMTSVKDRAEHGELAT